MSANNTLLSELSEEINLQYSPALINSYFLVCAAVIVLYDYILTFPLELSLIWNGKYTLVKILFALNRYSGIIFIYSNALPNLIKPASQIVQCIILYYVFQITNFSEAIAVFSIFTLRLFAIYRRSWIVFLVLSIPACIFVVSGIWTAVAQTFNALPLELQIGPIRCNLTSSNSVFTSTNSSPNNVFIIHYSSGYLISFIALAVFDALVVVLTVYRTARFAMQTQEANISSLSFIFLRDGLLYYTIIFVPVFILVALEAANLITNNLEVDYVSLDVTSIVNALQTIAVNRLVLNLSHAANVEDDTEYRTRTGFEPPVFATNPLIGNIGAPIRSLLTNYHDENIQEVEKDNTSTESYSSAYSDPKELRNMFASGSGNGEDSMCEVVAQHGDALRDSYHGEVQCIPIDRKV